MFLYQYILLAGFVCLLFNEKTRFASAVFLTGWVVYLLVTIGASTAFYYIASASIETAIATALNNKHKYISYLGYSLIAVNIYGLSVHLDIDGRNNYIVIYAVVSIAQFILLLTRLIPDGIRRLCIQRITLRYRNFDGSKTCAKMYKNTSKGKDLK